MKLNEFYQEEPGGTFTHAGEEYDLNAVLEMAANIPEQEFNVKDLDWILVFDYANPERVKTADLTTPILVTTWFDPKDSKYLLTVQCFQICIRL